MRAVILPAVQTNTELVSKPIPVPKDNESLIQLHAAAWNRRDYWITQGKYPGIITPVTLGSDGFGTVESSNNSINLIGENVLICPSINWGDNEAHPSYFYSILGMPLDGTAAEAIAISNDLIVKAPTHLSAEEGATIPLAGLTAWRAVSTKANIQPGEHILITGIGAATALFAMQFALAMGAIVTVTSSSDHKIQRAIAMGAKQGVKYTDSDWAAQLQRMQPAGFNVIVDSAGGEGFGSLLRLLGMAGRLVFFGGTRGKWPKILPQHLFFKQVSILATTMGSPKEFCEMVTFIDTHKIRPVIDSVYQLEDHQASMERMNHPERFGKVVLQTS